jgi:hypothetical protein
MIKHEECIETLKWAVERMQKLEKIEGAIREYHFALDNRKHGGVAQDVALNRIMDVLDMHWRYVAKKQSSPFDNEGKTREL